MKIYGVGLFHAPRSSRVVWDFVDGPFDTVNPVLIKEAKKRGFSFSPLAETKTNGSEKPNSSTTPKDTLFGRIFKKRGRKPKGVENVNAKTDRNNRD